MGKLVALFRVLQAGHAVASPARWKAGQVTVNALAALLVALAAVSSAFGYPIPATSEQVTAVAGGLLALVNVLLTVATSETVGLPSKPGGDGEPGKPEPAPPRWGDDETQL